MRLVNKNLFHLHLGWGRNKWSKMHIQWALTQSNKGSFGHLTDHFYSLPFFTMCYKEPEWEMRRTGVAGVGAGDLRFFGKIKVFFKNQKHEPKIVEISHLCLLLNPSEVSP